MALIFVISNNTYSGTKMQYIILSGQTSQFLSIMTTGDWTGVWRPIISIKINNHVFLHNRLWQSSSDGNQADAFCTYPPQKFQSLVGCVQIVVGLWRSREKRSPVLRIFHISLERQHLDFGDPQTRYISTTVSAFRQWANFSSPTQGQESPGFPGRQWCVRASAAPVDCW